MLALNKNPGAVCIGYSFFVWRRDFIEFLTPERIFTAVSIMLSINSFVTHWNPNFRDSVVRTREPGVRRQFTQFIRIFPSAEHKVSKERKKVTRRAGISDMNTNHLIQTSMTHIKCFWIMWRFWPFPLKHQMKGKLKVSILGEQRRSSRPAKSDQWEQKSFVSLAAQNLIWIRKWTLKFDW